MINPTHMTRSFGKLPNNFQIMEKKEEFIQALEHRYSDMNIGLPEALMALATAESSSTKTRLPDNC